MLNNFIVPSEFVPSSFHVIFLITDKNSEWHWSGCHWLCSVFLPVLKTIHLSHLLSGFYTVIHSWQHLPFPFSDYFCKSLYWQALPKPFQNSCILDPLLYRPYFLLHLLSLSKLERQCKVLPSFTKLIITLIFICVLFHSIFCYYFCQSDRFISLFDHS